MLDTRGGCARCSTHCKPICRPSRPGGTPPRRAGPTIATISERCPPNCGRVRAIERRRGTMQIEYLVAKSPMKQHDVAPTQSVQGSSPPQETMIPPSQVESYLVNLEGTMHNGPATQLLCAAATWAYSDLKAFASVMSHRGLYGEYLGINVTNQVTFVDTTAYLFL